MRHDATVLEQNKKRRKQIVVEYRKVVSEKVLGHFVIEHWMSNEEMEEHFNEEVKQCWRFGAHVARITDGNACSEDCKHTSG